MSPSRILVVKLSAMGDVIHALPAVHRLRDLLPHAEIHWLISARWAPLLEGVGSVDEVITLDRGTGSYLSAMRLLREKGYNIAVDLQGLLKSAVLSRASGAGMRVGFAPAFAREPVASFLYNRRVFPTKEHIVEQLVEVAESAASALGIPFSPFAFTPTFCLAPTETEVEWAKGCLKSLGLSPPFAVLLPGTGWKTKTWHPQKFSELAGLLLDRFALPSLVVWGPGEEELIPEGKGIFVAPPTDLREMMALLSLSSLVVGGDTGPLHMAVAVGTPAVGIYGPTLPERNGPYSDRTAVVVKECPHRGQHKRECSEPCVESIAVSQVFDAVERLLLRLQSPTSW